MLQPPAQGVLDRPVKPDEDKGERVPQPRFIENAMLHNRLGDVTGAKPDSSGLDPRISFCSLGDHPVEPGDDDKELISYAIPSLPGLTRQSRTTGKAGSQPCPILYISAL